MLRYESYNKDRLAIYGDKEKYASHLKAIGARWNSKMDEPGWNIRCDRESDLKKLIKKLQ